MRVLLLNQTFYPDVVSTAQHLSDLGYALAEQGHDVTVVASRRAYDDPQKRFPKRECWNGVEVVRIPASGFGKQAKWRRAVDFATFLLACTVRLLLLPRYDVVVALTSPPLISFLAALFVRLKGGRLMLWIMDLNPDEALAAGCLKADSPLAALFQRMQKYSFDHAQHIIALDRFMKERIAAAGVPADKITVLPPWAHDDAVRYDESARQEFRSAHRLSGKFVVMYAGNHSPCHPLDTLLEAARRLRDDPRIAFCFVGGGSEFQKVKAFARDHHLPGITCLPYQPLTRLSGSLSSADLHVVVMGDPFVGIVHPCKVYNIATIGSPFLYIGPSQSHITDLVNEAGYNGAARTARHGDVDTVARHIREAASNGINMKREITTAAVVRFTKRSLLPHMLNVLQPQ